MLAEQLVCAAVQVAHRTCSNTLLLAWKPVQGTTLAAHPTDSSQTWRSCRCYIMQVLAQSCLMYVQIGTQSASYLVA
jgi:hypothetical protein